ncbi:MAG TPA: PDGLE domain-containing protein [Bacillota bacterium]|nr:PDGLE domain-containing protein [Bacillota bacterium]
MKKPLLILFLLSLAIAAFLSPFASPDPDGLDRVAQDLGFEERSEGADIVRSPIPDYKFPGVGSETAATAFAGALGTLVTFGAAYGFGKAVLTLGKK